jgi:PAS domain S-box-containing protein
MKKRDKGSYNVPAISQEMQEGAKHDRMLLAAALEQAQDTVAIARTDGIISYVNPAFEKMTGFPSADIIGSRLDKLFQEVIKDSAFDSKWSAIDRGEGWHGRARRKKRTGEVYEVDTTITPIYDANRETVVAYVIVERDLSNEMRIEQQMRQSQKMEALGTLAGGIAHDLNNILMPIILNAELMLEEMPEDYPFRRSVLKILNAAHRGRDLVKQVVAFSREGEQERHPLNLPALLKEALELVRASLVADIEIKPRFEVSSGILKSNPSQIQQVLLNLCTNAADAIGDHTGEIEIALTEVEVGAGEAKSRDLAPGPYFKLSVRDTGAGMTPEVMEHIFEPFFTTKAPGEGTGMGLAVVHGIVSSHRGRIEVESRVGGGSAFHLFLPRADAEKPATEPSETSVPRGDGAVLLIDDDLQIVETVCEVLEGLGYRVASEHDPERGLRRFSEAPGAFNLVVTDQTMRGIKGIDLAAAIHRINADTPIILCTGHIDLVDRDRLRRVGVVDVMMKPLTRGELARSVDRAMRRSFEQ